MANEGFLNRWSRLKRDSVAPAAAPASEREPAPAPVSVPSPAPDGLGSGDNRAAAMQPASPSAPADPVVLKGEPTPALPPLEELDLDSDYSAFMRAEVDPARRMSALKKLFSDPHFNRMDGLDVYIDDYSKPDPIPKAMLARLNQSRLLGLFEEEDKAARDAWRRETAGEAMSSEELPAPSAAPPAGADAAAGEAVAGDASGPAAGSDAPADPAPAASFDALPDSVPKARPGSLPDSLPDPPPDSTPDLRQAT